MASCKDCIHDKVCSEYFHVFWGHTANKHSDLINADPKDCSYFKDSSRFVELPHAEWVEDEDIYGDPIYRCSNCNEHFVLEEGTPTDNCYSYCPNCGAKMDEQALKERENNG